MNGMSTRTQDGSAGDADYATIGFDYRRYRQPEPEFEAAIHAAIDDARTVLNVGAGAGSYEPRDRQVTAVEPSASMRAQRPSSLPEAIDATAESLPFEDDTFDATMTTFSAHQWQDLRAGLAQLRRVTTGPVVVMTCDPELLDRFWLNDYAPEVIATEARRYPPLPAIAEGLGGSVEIVRPPIPLHCQDGFSEAYYGRPEMFLEPGARLANSAWSFVPVDRADNAITQLRSDLTSGAWDSRHGRLRTQPHHKGSLAIVISRP